jgi:mono/diheme cytochrome c family protein
MNFRKRLLAVAALAGVGVLAHAQAPPGATRGQLLYNTHCINCHTTQMHWRDDRQAHDWDSLKMQVRRWQGNAGLQWDEADIAEVARHLNDTIYRFPDRVSVASRRAPR